MEKRKLHFSQILENIFYRISALNVFSQSVDNFFIVLLLIIVFLPVSFYTSQNHRKWQLIHWLALTHCQRFRLLIFVAGQNEKSKQIKRLSFPFSVRRNPFFTLWPSYSDLIHRHSLASRWGCGVESNRTNGNCDGKSNACQCLRLQSERC